MAREAVGRVPETGSEIGSVNQERKLLRWAGIAGILGGIVFLFVPVVQFGFVPPAPSDPMAVVARFPTIGWALTTDTTSTLHQTF